MDTSVTPYLTQAGESELRWTGETATYFLATGELTGGAFALVDERAERGETVPLHRHDADVESFYVLEGELMLFIGDGRPGVRAAAGAFAHVPAGTVHGFRVESETARYLLLTTPRHGDFYRAISRAEKGPVSGLEIEAAAREYGIDFVGPLPPGDGS